MQQLGLFQQIVGKLAEIFHRLRGIFVSAGDQQRIQLGLGGGDGNHFYNIFTLGVFLYSGITANTVMVVDWRTDGKAVQQGGDGKLFGHVNRLLYPLYHK